MTPSRILPLVLLFAVLCGWTYAHEPYLQLTADAAGTFTAEAGFSDGSDVAGLMLLVRDRATGATLGEHPLPTGGKLVLPIPAVPYRVTFDGGPGHKVSKLGPERAVAVAAAESAVSVEPGGAKKEPAAQPGTASTPPVSAGAGDEGRGDFSRALTVVTLVFLLAVVSFALGFFAASRRTTQR